MFFYEKELARLLRAAAENGYVNSSVIKNVLGVGTQAEEVNALDTPSIPGN